MEQDPPIKSVKTAFDIIELLAEQESARISTIAEELDLPKSTIHDHLSTLKQLEYVGKSEQKYRSNLKFLELGGIIRESRDIVKLSEAELQKVANETGEHATLMIEENDYGIYVFTVPGDHLQQILVPIGTHTPLYVSAPGKAILANLPQKRRQKLLEIYPLKPITENTVTDKGQLKTELDEVRDQGYSIDKEEGQQGLQGIAKPIISPASEEVLGAISVYGPSGSANLEFLQGEALRSLERAANVIEHKLSSRKQ